jgi:hypothetical protein
MNFYKRKQKRISDNYIYTDSLITRCVYLSIMEIDKNLKETNKQSCHPNHCSAQ